MAEEKNNPHGNREVPDWASGSWNPPHHAPLFGSGYEYINFAEILDPQGWRAHAAQKSAVKEKMPRMVFELLSAYLINANTSLERTTFSHIVTFFQTGREAGRLSVACADFGYSVDELRALRTAGSTALDVAAEIIGRGSR